MNISLITLLVVGGILFLFAKSIRRKKSDSIKAVGGVLAVLAVVGLFMGWSFDPIGQRTLSAAPTNVQPPADLSTLSPAEHNCPDTGLGNIYYRIKDDQATTLTYLTDIDMYFKDGGALRTGNESFVSDYAYTTLECPESFTIYAVSKSQNSSSIVKENVPLTKAKEYIDLSADALDSLQLRVENVANDSYFVMTRGDNETNASTFTTLNNSLLVADSASLTEIGIGADGYFDFTIHAKTVATNKVNGENGLRNWMCVDANTGTWEEPSVGINGVKLLNQKTSMYPQDLVATPVSNSEYCYDIGQLGDTDTKISFYIKTASGQDPATGGNDDIVLHFAPEGRFKSAQDPNSVKVGAFQDDTSHTQVHYGTGGSTTSELQRLTIDVK